MKYVWNPYSLIFLEEMGVPRIPFSGGWLYYGHDPFKIEDHIIYMPSDGTYSWESVWIDEDIEYFRVAKARKDGTIELF